MLNELAEKVIEENFEKGWNVLTPSDWEDTYKIPALLALITSEVSEALEAFRKDDKENFAEEIADVQIRLLDLAAGLYIDLDKEVEMKMEKNRKREYRHGGRRL